MSEGAFVIASATVAEVTRDVRVYGELDLETGGFLMAHAGSDELTGVALAGTTGITRRPYLFQISERALAQLFTFAGDRGLWLPIQYHSHQGAAVMSPSDRRHGLRVEDFVSVIIPDFTAPPSDVNLWGWWRFRRGEWAIDPAATVRPGRLQTTVIFDEDGVRAA